VQIVSVRTAQRTVPITFRLCKVCANSVSTYRAENCPHYTGQAVYVFKGNDCFILRLIGQDGMCYKIVQVVDIVTSAGGRHSDHWKMSGISIL